MLTDKEIMDAVNEAPLGHCGATTVISVGRAIEAKVLEKLRAQFGESVTFLEDEHGQVCGSPDLSKGAA